MSDLAFKLSCSTCGEVTYMGQARAEKYLHEAEASPCCNTRCYSVMHLPSARAFENTIPVLPLPKNPHL